MTGPGQGTTQRFVLLLTVFIAGSVSMFSIVFQQLADPKGYGLACEVAAGADPNIDSPANGLNTATPGFSDCLTLHAGAWRYHWLPLAAVALVLALAVAHYRLYPWWESRHRRFVPLDKADHDGGLRGALAGLASRAGIAGPAYLVDRSAGGAGARVFGRRGDYTVALDTGLIALFGRDRGAFDATMLHEFAHIRNRDVGITYLTVAIWRVFLVCALTPFAITQAYALVTGLLSRRPSFFLPGELPNEAGDIALAAATVVLIYLAMADVLRAREHVADLDADSLGAARVYWLRKVPDAPAGIARGLRTHPTWARRYAVLTGCADIHTVGATSMVVTGMAGQLLAGFMAAAPIGLGYSWITGNAALLAAALTTAVAGLMVWRNVAREIAAGRSAPSGLRAGFWLGAGQFAGALLASETAGNAWLPPLPWALLAGLLVLGPPAILWWTAGCAAAWSRLPGLIGRAAQAATLAVTLAAFVWWFDWWLTDGTLYILGNPDPGAFTEFLAGFPHTTTTDVMAPLMSIVTDLDIDDWGIWLTGALWLLPLIAHWRTGRRRSGRGAGVWAGCGAAAAVTVITFRAHSWIRGGDVTISQNSLIYDAWLFGILACASAAAAIIASLRGGGRAVPAMTAAGIAAAIGSAAVVAVSGTDGCVGPLTVVPQDCTLSNGTNWGLYSIVFEWLLPMIGMLTLVAAATVTGVVRAVTSARRAPSEPEREKKPGRRPARWLPGWAGPTAVCLVLAGLSIPSYAGVTGPVSGSDASSGPTAPVTGPGRLLSLQMTAWAGLDGVSLIDRFHNDARELAALNPDGSAHASATRRVCTDVSSAAAAARAYLPPPDAAIVPSWSTTVGQAATGAAECLAGLSRHDPPLAVTGIVAIYDAEQTLYNSLSAQIDADLHGSP